MENLVFSLNAAVYDVLPLVINLLLALVFILVGVLIARGLGNLTTLILKIIQLDILSGKIGFAGLLEKGEVKKTVSELLGSLVYWVIVLVVLLSAATFFNLPVQRAFLFIFAYMGLVFLAALILGIGVLLAGLISGIVKAVMANLGIEGAKTVSRLIYYIVIIFTFLAALAELGISMDVFVPQIGVIIGAFGLAAAIAFGLGCKDMAADFLHNLFKGK